MKKLRYKLPVSGKKTSLGITFSDDAISYVELEATKYGVRVGRFGEAKLKQGTILNKETSLLKAMSIIKKKTISRKSALALSDDIATFFELSVKETSPVIIEKVVKSEIAKSFPGGKSVIVESKKLYTEKNMTQVAVAVIPKEKITNATDIFEKSGIKLSALVLETEAVADVISPTDGSLFVELGENHAKISVISHGSLVLQGSVTAGTNAMIKALSEMSGLPESESKETLFLHGISPKSHDPLFSAFSPFLRKITDEADKLLLYWHIDCKQEKECRLEKIILLGAGALIPGLAPYISNTLSMPVEIPDPFLGMPLYSGNVPEMTRGEALTHLPALALAIKQLTI